MRLGLSLGLELEIGCWLGVRDMGLWLVMEMGCKLGMRLEMGLTLGFGVGAVDELAYDEWLGVGVRDGVMVGDEHGGEFRDGAGNTV